jgi:hypothetical protein
MLRCSKIQKCIEIQLTLSEMGYPAEKENKKEEKIMFDKNI